MATIKKVFNLIGLEIVLTALVFLVAIAAPNFRKSPSGAKSPLNAAAADNGQLPPGFIEVGLVYGGALESGAHNRSNPFRPTPVACLMGLANHGGGAMNAAPNKKRNAVGPRRSESTPRVEDMHSEKSPAGVSGSIYDPTNGASFSRRIHRTNKSDWTIPF